jgi:hypothetical protein
MFLFDVPISHSPLSLHLLFLSAAKFSFIFGCERSCATSPQPVAINIGLVPMLLQMAWIAVFFFDVESVAFKRRSKKTSTNAETSNRRIQVPKNKSPCLGYTQQAIEATALP